MHCSSGREGACSASGSAAGVAAAAAFVEDCVMMSVWRLELGVPNGQILLVAAVVVVLVVLDLAFRGLAEAPVCCMGSALPVGWSWDGG